MGVACVPSTTQNQGYGSQHLFMDLDPKFRNSLSTRNNKRLKRVRFHPMICTLDEGRVEGWIQEERFTDEAAKRVSEDDDRGRRTPRSFTTKLDANIFH